MDYEAVGLVLMDEDDSPAHTGWLVDYKDWSECFCASMRRIMALVNQIILWSKKLIRI